MQRHAAHSIMNALTTFTPRRCALVMCRATSWNKKIIFTSHLTPSLRRRSHLHCSTFARHFFVFSCCLLSVTPALMDVITEATRAGGSARCQKLSLPWFTDINFLHLRVHSPSVFVEDKNTILFGFASYYTVHCARRGDALKTCAIIK